MHGWPFWTWWPFSHPSWKHFSPCFTPRVNYSRHIVIKRRPRCRPVWFWNFWNCVRFEESIPHCCFSFFFKIFFLFFPALSTCSLIFVSAHTKMKYTGIYSLIVVSIYYLIIVQSGTQNLSLWTTEQAGFTLKAKSWTSLFLLYTLDT